MHLILTILYHPIIITAIYFVFKVIIFFHSRFEFDLNLNFQFLTNYFLALAKINSLTITIITMLVNSVIFFNSIKKFPNLNICLYSFLTQFHFFVT